MLAAFNKPTAAADVPFVTVPGNKVLRSMRMLARVPYAHALQAMLGGTLLEAYSHETKMLVAPKEGGYTHGFIAAFHMAYAKHYPLVLSPDMIWLLIAQGFALHVRENAETLRHRFVVHEGKVTLTVERPKFVRGFEGNDWEGVFTEFSAQIRDHIGEAAHDALVPTFSTTGIVAKAAFEVALLDSMKQYFNYDLLCVCGIPSFRLEGTTDDWRRLRDKASALADYDLDWWTPHLLKVLDEFVAASEGKPTPAFWQDFFCEGSCNGDPMICGEPHFKGHIVNFFPYLAGKKPGPDSYAAQHYPDMFGSLRAVRSQYLGKRIRRTSARVPWEGGFRYQYEPDEFHPHQGITDCYLPSGLSVAPFVWIGRERSYPMEFVAGFVGAAQDKKTRAIRPEIGWAVRERANARA